jgi:hypothetical protein
MKVLGANPLPKLAELLEQRKTYLSYKAQGGKMTYQAWQAKLKDWNLGGD